MRLDLLKRVAFSQRYLMSKLRRKLSMLRLVVSALLLSLAGCSFSSTSRPLFELVPSRSFIAVSINWRVVSQDEELKRLLKVDAVEGMFTELGIASNEVSELTVFSDGQSSTSGGGIRNSSGVLLRGSYQPQGIVSRLKGKGWSEGSEKGIKTLSNAATDEWCGSLKSNAFICGTKAGVEGAIGAERDAKESFSGNLTYGKMVDRLRGTRSPILMIAEFPQEMQDIAEVALQASTVALNFANLGGLGSVLEKIGYVRGFGCALSHKGGELPVEMLALMKNEQAASIVAGTLNIMQKLTLAAPKSNLSAGDMNELRKIQSISVTRYREMLSIKAVMSTSNFRRSG